MRRVLLVSAAAVLASAAPVAAAPPPLQAVRIEREIPAPKGTPWVDAVGAALFTADQRHIIATVWDGADEQAGVANLDGSGFHCITCGLVAPIRSPEPFPDGRRLFVSGTLDGGVGGQGTADTQYSVIECAPSLIDCAQRRLMPITLPIPGLTSLPQGAQNREGGISPDGTHFKWTEVRTFEGTRMTIGRLVRGDSGYTLTDLHVLNPPWSMDGDAAAWEAGSRFYEAQGYSDGWAQGGRILKYGTQTTALNYDIWELDLATGARRQLTTDPDYNENADYSPDSRWVAYSSARGLERMTVFTQVPRPPLLDMIGFAQVGRVGLNGNRRCMNERWLMDEATGQQPGGYAGQPILLADDEAIRSWAWSRDGTRALVVADHITRGTYDSGDVHVGTRMLVLRFPGLRPTRPDPVVDLDTIGIDRWAIPYGDFHGMAAQPAAAHVLAGPKGGTATITYAGAFAGGTFSVRFDRWSQDGRSFLSGTEQVDVPNPLVASHYAADLTLTGAHTGTMHADLLMRAQTASGSIDSTYDGHHLSGVPTQADCPGLHRPALQLTLLRRTRAPHGRLRLTLRVTSRVAGDAEDRPVLAATVSAGRVRATTDAHGRVRLVVRRLRWPATITADAGSFAPAIVRVSRTARRVGRASPSTSAAPSAGSG